MSNDDRYIYEVIRVIGGKPLFLEQHYDRLAATLELQGAPGILSADRFAKALGAFVESEGIVNDNIKFILRLNGQNAETEFEYIHKEYPTAEQYADGVPTQFLQAMRDNPHAKVHNQDLRELSNKLIAENNLFEVILVDNDGFVTEGSRSNIFFIRGGKVCTSPSDGVLLGVTRQEIIKVCQANNIPVIEEQIKASSIDDYDAAFVSGTSPKVLPIANIGDVKMNVNDETLRELMRLFDEHIEQYLVQH